MSHAPVKWNPPALVDRLVNENMRLAHFWKAKMAWRWGDNDALSIALEGLLKAARIWRKGRKLSFGTFASVCIRFRFNRYRVHAERGRRGGGVSHLPLDGKVFGSEQSVGEVIADENAVRPSEGAIQSEAAEKVEQLLSMLTPRNRTIMQMRYGLGGYHPSSLEEVATKFNLTRERVRQVQAHSLRLWWRKQRYLGLSIREDEELAS